MARSTAPEYSRGNVKRAGRAVRSHTATAHDHRVIENFRASHAHILNAFQASLRNRARDKEITVAQRLKRRVTIYDKLRRHPTFSLTEMQDIAGCRLIFPCVKELEEFRHEFHGARFKHKLLSGDDRYDYISRPKPDGYRGVHDVYGYESSRPEGAAWNRLRIELQYRSVFQHAWATAVEVAGLLTDNEHKFGRAAPDYEEFFQVSSELIARVFENRNSCLPTYGDVELIEALEQVDGRIGLLNLFRQYNRVAPTVRAINKNVILIFNKHAEPGKETEYHHFASFADAVRRLESLEEANLSADEPYDIVLVRSVGPLRQGSIQNAFRNYFADTRDFIAYLDHARAEILAV